MAASPPDLEIPSVEQLESPVESAAGTKASGSKKKQAPAVIVDDQHPFDLDAYISNYTDRTAVLRLLSIAHSSPTLAPQAFQLALQYIQQTRDAKLYLNTVQEYNNLPSTVAPIEPDKKWVEETQMQNTADRNKLEVELKNYSSNMIKESIRMGHRDLGDYHRSLGDHASALKHYTKSREFCTTSQHVLDMCLSVLELLIEQHNYSHIMTYVFKSDAALDVAAPSGGSQGASSKKNAANPERERVQAKLDFATALSHLGQGNYEKAAFGFLKLGKSLDDWFGKVVSPSDIAIYGTLCALARLSRSSIKASVVESETFVYYLEQEPYVRELVEAYMASKFKVVLEILNRNASRHLLDIHLAPHVESLTTQIFNRAIVLYFQPFTSIRLESMADAFGMTVAEIEKHIVSLIQDGSIKGRVDSQNKILKAKDLDHRSALFTRALKAGQEMQSANRKLLLRMSLVQADLIVKAPKGRGGMGGGELADMIAAVE